MPAVVEFDHQQRRGGIRLAEHEVDVVPSDLPEPISSARTTDYVREANLRAKAIGVIDVLDRTTFVEIPKEEADHVIDALRNSSLRGRKVKVQLAHPSEIPEARPPRHGRR